MGCVGSFFVMRLYLEGHIRGNPKISRTDALTIVSR